MKILITGVSGFIGHHIVRRCLEEDWEIIGVDKRWYPEEHAAEYLVGKNFIQANVQDLGFRDLMGVDYVIHLAFATNIPNSVRHPKETTYENIDMTVHLMEVCKEAGIKKFLFPSTASLYGSNPTPWTEDMIPMPIEPYSWQKFSLEEACKMYSRIYGLPTVIFRFFQVFGEFQRDDTALAAFIRNKKDGKPITLTETMAQSGFRSGQRDFIYAGDLADAVIKAAVSDKTGNAEILNVANGECHTMEQIAEAIGGKVEWIPRRGYEVERHHGDISKIKKLLNWHPQVDVIDWIKKNA